MVMHPQRYFRHRLLAVDINSPNKNIPWDGIENVHVHVTQNVDFMPLWGTPT
jgi:hypothetical protein